MLLNFQKQFALPVMRGEKRQTIRARGKRVHAPKVGDTAYCYTGLRTSKTLPLGAWPIERVDVLRMEFELDHIVFALRGADSLYTPQLKELAQADGFASLAEMAKWFVANHGGGEFDGWIITWAWDPSGGGGNG